MLSNSDGRTMDNQNLLSEMPETPSEYASLSKALAEAEAKVKSYELLLEEMVQARTAELEIRNSQLEEERERLAAILEATPDFVSIATLEGNATYYNRGARKLLGIGIHEDISSIRILNHHTESSREQLIRKAIPTAIEKGEWYGESELIHSSGKEFILSQLILAHKSPDGTVSYLSTVGRDITGYKQVEKMLVENERRHRLLKEVATAANAAMTVNDAFQIAINSIAAYTGWPLGHIYLTETGPESEVLTDSGLWYCSDPARFQTFKDVTRNCRFKPGEGLPGWTMAADKSTWIENIAGNTCLVRRQSISLENGLLGAFAFPVKAKGRVAAVLEFFSEETVVPTPSFLDLMDQVAFQLSIVIERKKAEAEQAKLLSAVEESPASVVITDDKGIIEYVNPKFCRVTGYTSAEAIGQNPKILKSGGQPDEFYKELWETISSGREWRGELCNKKKNGEIYWESASIAPVKRADGTVSHYVAVKEDITGKRAADEILWESEERYRSLVDLTPDIIFRLDESGQILYISPAVAQLGYDPLELRGAPFTSFIHPEDRETIRNQFQEMQTGHMCVNNLEIHLISKDFQEGFHEDSHMSRYAVSYRTIPILIPKNMDKTNPEICRLVSPSDRHDFYVQGVAHDISVIDGLKDVATALISASTLDEIADQVLKLGKRITGSQYGFLRHLNPNLHYMVSPAFTGDVTSLCRMRKWSPDMKSCGGLFGWVLNNKKPFFSNSPFQDPRSIGIPEGHIPIEQVIVVPAVIPSMDGRPEEIIGQIAFANPGRNYTQKDLDIAIRLCTQFVNAVKRLRMEKELESAKHTAEAATRAKSSFLAIMSHEIRTPINAIIGFSDLAMNGVDMSPMQRDYIDKIHSAGLSLQGIINDILDFSKIEANKLELEQENFELVQVIDYVMLLAEQKIVDKNLEFRLQISPAVPSNLIGDSLRLRQILVNLVINAVKFTDSGYIALKVESIESVNERVKLLFEIQDSGIGMTSDHTANLFQAFTQADGSTTRKYGGTGLGLTISKQLIELMDGQIWVNSEFGKGTSFFFTVWMRVDDSISSSRTPLSGSIPWNETLSGKNEPVHFLPGTFVSGAESANGMADLPLVLDLLDQLKFFLENNDSESNKFLQSVKHQLKGSPLYRQLESRVQRYDYAGALLALEEWMGDLKQPQRNL